MYGAVFSIHNSNLWAWNNLHAIYNCGYEVCFSIVSIWAGIIGATVIGLYLLPDRLINNITIFWKLFYWGCLKMYL